MFPGPGLRRLTDISRQHEIVTEGYPCRRQSKDRARAQVDARVGKGDEGWIFRVLIWGSIKNSSGFYHKIIRVPAKTNPGGNRKPYSCVSGTALQEAFGTRISKRAPFPGSPVSAMVIPVMERISRERKRPRPVCFP